MTGKWIEVTAHDGGKFGAWLALPPDGPNTKTGPGIVLMQEIWGVNAHIRTVAEQYANDGFVVLAPDVFWRQQPRIDLAYNEADTKMAFGYMQALDQPNAVKDIASGVTVLRAMSEVKGGVASLGYCMGGRLAYLAAADAGVDAAICYYPGGIAQCLDRAATIKAPLLFHFAEKDGYIPADAVEAVKKTFRDRDNARVDTYPDVDHGFNCWGRPNYRQRSAALAHGRSLAFLATHLG